MKFVDDNENEALTRLLEGKSVSNVFYISVSSFPCPSSGYKRQDSNNFLEFKHKRTKSLGLTQDIFTMQSIA
jgi:hypothetical protein